LSEAASQAMRTDDVAKNLKLQTTEPHQGSPDDFAKYIEQKRKRWTDVVDTAGLHK
jgi:tripartite-type tricarboxylate transporter receptor subunit TctC